VRNSRYLLGCVLATWLAQSGCTTFCHEQRALAPPEELGPSEGLVLVVDGAGDFRATSEALRRAVATARLPLRVVTFIWSHGPYRVFADQLDEEHALQEGHRLAETILAVRQSSPGRPIYVVAHSAGCAVGLAAASDLPPDSIQRMILFAPSVPADYDLRPALCCVRNELDVFTSLSDRWYLWASDFFTSITRCRFCTAAGCAGFRPIILEPRDARLYQKLRDYPWQPTLIWTGHDGGHFGYYQQGHLRTIVLPLLMDQPPA
jgi:pimeloyl-ACP methyl ester carboxylesterase